MIGADHLKKKLSVIAGSTSLTALLLTPMSFASAASGPTPLTYQVSVNGFQNDRLYTSDTTQNSSTLASVGEPQIVSDPLGNFFIGSEYGLGGGTGFWGSTNGGTSYKYGGLANSLVNGSPAQAGGGDVAMAVATAKNSSGLYNIYTASLSLANIDVSTSADGGRTFTTNFASSNVPIDDREWIAASGANTVYLSYHDISTDNIDVERSDDAGKSWKIIGGSHQSTFEL